ncbi:MAG: HAMP domain-containing protein [Anaerolineales bacterium]|nr:HAMP domain-containing protein [Anaerolineales bacterium]
MTRRLPLSLQPPASGGLMRSLLWMMLPLTLTPLLVTAFSFYRQSEAELTRHLNIQLDTLVNAKLIQIRQWANQQVMALETLAQDITPDALTADRASELRPQLEAFLTTHSAFQRVLLVNAADFAVWLDLGVDPARAPTFSESSLQWAKYEPRFIPPRLWPELDAETVSLIVTAPIASGDQGAIAVLVGILRQEPLLQIVAPVPGLGSTGQAYLVSADGYRLGVQRGSPRAQPRSETIRRVLDQAASGSGLYANADGVTVIGRYVWINDYQLALFVEQEWAEAAAPLENTLGLIASVTLGCVVLVSMASIFFTLRLTRPIRVLTEIATRIAAGDLAAQVDIQRNDELGVLAQTFNRMSEDLRISYQTLQATAESRARQLAITTEISRVAATYRNLAQLLPEVTDLIRRRFGYDCVLAFLANESGQLRLHEVSGGPLEKLKSHPLIVELESNSLLGFAARNRRAYTETQAEAPALHRLDVRLAEFQSEVVLPLAVGDRLLGALVCLSHKANAFSGADFDILQTLADQVAVAIESCQLFERQQSLLRLEELVLSLLTKAHRSLRAEDILESTAVELGRALGARRAVVRLHSSGPENGKALEGRWE